MPYAYIHYPFENQELFDRNFPGHFVAEGLDQTRGWYAHFPFLQKKFRKVLISFVIGLSCAYDYNIGLLVRL